MNMKVAAQKMAARLNRLTFRGMAGQALALTALMLLTADPIRADAPSRSFSLEVSGDANPPCAADRSVHIVCGDDDDEEEGMDYEGSGRPDID